MDGQMNDFVSRVRANLIQLHNRQLRPWNMLSVRLQKPTFSQIKERTINLYKQQVLDSDLWPAIVKSKLFPNNNLFFNLLVIERLWRRPKGNKNVTSLIFLYHTVCSSFSRLSWLLFTRWGHKRALSHSESLSMETIRILINSSKSKRLACNTLQCILMTGMHLLCYFLLIQLLFILLNVKSVWIGLDWIEL